jgi:uncharacterized repeat protein (TIGR03803 family)
MSSPLKSIFCTLTATLILTLPVVSLAQVRAASQTSPVATLFSFTSAGSGSVPSGGLTTLNGEIYGAAGAAGGKGKNGTTFVFDPATNSVRILHAFGDGIDGEQPYGGPIALGDTLYGTTFQGGAVGFGTVYKLDPIKGLLNTAHSFTSAADGGHPESQLAELNGALYGTTYDGGNAPSACINENLYWGCGVIFKYDPAKNKTTVAYAFSGPDGFLPSAALAAANGVLYGVTERGGSKSTGTVFSLDPTTGALKTLHAFSYGPHEGAGPMTSVVVVGQTLYGTTAYGGSTKLCITGPSRCGTLFQIDLTSHAYTTLYRFNGGSNGFLPTGITYSNGALYGLTYGGGKHGRGSLFKLDPVTKTLTTLYSFAGGGEGAVFYGVTSAGGYSNVGTIFRFTP